MSEFSKDSGFKQEADRQERYKQTTLTSGNAAKDPWIPAEEDLESLRKQASLQMDLEPLVDEAIGLIHKNRMAEAVRLLEEVQNSLRSG